MNAASLIVHRATHQIGGNCIEIIAQGGERILLDLGRPLEAGRDAKDLIPASLSLTSPVLGLMISHPHQDHYGLIEEAPDSWPVYSGRAAGLLMHLTASIFGAPPKRDYRHWESGKAFDLGSFRVTPLLTDHSAFDAYMLLIEVSGRRILYSGDFRIHGRKSSLVRKLMASPPKDIDVLLMEGTNLGSDKSTRAESELENDFTSLFQKTPGRVFICWSAQNIDRTVTIYRACLKANRTLVVDLYTAEVLELLAASGTIPQAGWKNLKVVITRAFSRLYKSKGREDFIERMLPNAISAAALTTRRSEWVAMIRPSLMRDFKSKGVDPDGQDAWSYSQWHGYLKQPDGQALADWFGEGGSTADHIHTSGHASVAHLKEFAAAMRPRKFVPIHGNSWDSEQDGFDNLVRLRDGQLFEI